MAANGEQLSHECLVPRRGRSSNLASRMSCRPGINTPPLLTSLPCGAAPREGTGRSGAQPSPAASVLCLRCSDGSRELKPIVLATVANGWVGWRVAGLLRLRQRKKRTFWRRLGLAEFRTGSFQTANSKAALAWLLVEFSAPLESGVGRGRSREIGTVSMPMIQLKPR